MGNALDEVLNFLEFCCASLFSSRGEEYVKQFSWMLLNIEFSNSSSLTKQQPIDYNMISHNHEKIQLEDTVI